jgi:excisionase family DNA binding protein
MAKETMQKRFLSVAETAHYLGLSKRTIYNQLSAGTFPVRPRRYGRKVLFDLKDLERYADREAD